MKPSLQFAFEQLEKATSKLSPAYDVCRELASITAEMPELLTMLSGMIRTASVATIEALDALSRLRAASEETAASEPEPAPKPAKNKAAKPPINPPAALEGPGFKLGAGAVEVDYAGPVPLPEDA